MNSTNQADLPFGSSANDSPSANDTTTANDTPSVADILDGDDYHAAANFAGTDFSEFCLTDHTFEDCTFSSCHFREMSLSRVAFITCTFVSCEFTIVQLENTTLNTAHFRNCKLVGLNFAGCNKFGFLPDFDDCLLDSTVFCANNLKKARFAGCTIRNCDFMESDMREADFDTSSLEGTVFQKCNLERADFRRAHNYSIDPVNNRLAKARFSLPEAQSFLGFLGITLE